MYHGISELHGKKLPYHNRRERFNSTHVVEHGMNKTRRAAASLTAPDPDVVQRKIQDSALRNDLLYTLEYLRTSDGVNITKVRGTMGRKHVRNIIEGFREKPDIWPPEMQTDEWRYPRLMMIDAILRCLNLVEEKKKNSLTTTDVVGEFLELTPYDQFLNIFSAWWNYANWEVLTDIPTIQPEGRESNYFTLLEYLHEIGNGIGKFTMEDIVTKWRELCGNITDSENEGVDADGTAIERTGLGIVSFNSVRNLVVDPLIWFGFIREGKKGFVFDPTNEFSVSPLGSLMIGHIFSIKKEARLKAEIAKYGRSLDSFYRHSMYGLVTGTPVLADEEEEEESEQQYIPQDYAS